MIEPIDVGVVEVANPRHAELVALRTRLAAVDDALARALRQPATQMQAGTAWQGPTEARAFTEEVSGRAARLPRLVEHLRDEVEHGLATTPEMVVPGAP